MCVCVCVCVCLSCGMIELGPQGGLEFSVSISNQMTITMN